MPATAIERLLEARLHDPFTVLGLHPAEGGHVLRVFRPHAERVFLLTDVGEVELSRAHAAGLFEWHGHTPPARPWRLRVIEPESEYEIVDPYAFLPFLTDQELYLFNEGRLLQAYHTLGAHYTPHEGVEGVRFAVWAPNAERVSVVGDFNRWDGRVHPMRVRGSSGVWELFIPGLKPGDLYKFEIRNRDSGEILVKTDPYAQGYELRPGTAAVVHPPPTHVWQDADWLAARARHDWLHTPMNIYEVHAGSWRRHPDGRFYTYRELADALIPYVLDMGFTHIEFLPLTEHPLDESWGYQTTGYFAPTSRFGSADDLKYLIDACHRAGIGVILDWVPAHFPMDAWALARFDGTALYEHEDPRLGLHKDWGTHIFNYGRNEVKGFLLASAHYWLNEFHFDGLRVDAVASMLYLDYSRPAGQWIPNRFGGRENIDAIAFLRRTNTEVFRQFPQATTAAEESTAWPMVSRPVYLGGLGFGYKWNMGWMHDTLRYMSKDPIHRRYHHDDLTFGMLYAFHENFVLPLSHDEVVHGKGSIFGRMPGDRWQRFANLRAYYAFMWTHPGKKLLFMGSEFAQEREWDHNGSLDWHLLDDPMHKGVRGLVADLNRLYRREGPLHQLDTDPHGFAWIDCNDRDNSVITYLRRGFDPEELIVVACNFTPVPRPSYRVGVPLPGFYAEALNTDSEWYGGSNIHNGGGRHAEGTAWHGHPHSLDLTLPPLATVVLRRERA